ncbi:MAG: FG-GAP repeat domain-containing protein [Candidatus Hodarchaeota archaeon]
MARMIFFSKNILILMFIISLLPLNFFLGELKAEEIFFRGTGQSLLPGEDSNKPAEVWELSNTFIRGFGYDSKSGELIALGEDTTHFFFYRQPSEFPEWQWEKRYENYVREQPVGLLPFGDGDVAVLSRWLDNYRLHNLSTGEPFTDTFKADYETNPIRLYLDETTDQLWILKIYNGTASLLNKELTPLWQTTLYKYWPSVSSRIISLDTLGSCSLTWVVTGGGLISCLNLTDGTVIWQKSGLAPAKGGYYPASWMIADFNSDEITDIVCTFATNETTGFAVLNGVDGSTLWELENTLSWPKVLAIADFDQDGTNDLLLEQFDNRLASVWVTVLTVQSLSSNVPLWEKQFTEKPSGTSMVWWEFHVAEYDKQEPGFEILFIKGNRTDFYEDSEYLVQWEEEIRLVTAKSFSPLWDFEWSWGPGRQEDVPAWYWFPLPDLNGDGQADIYARDEEENSVIRDGGTRTVYAEVPCDNCGLDPYFQWVIPRNEDGPPILVMSDTGTAQGGNNYYCYSFNGIRVPTKGSSNGTGNSSSWFWTFLSLFFGAMLFVQKRKSKLRS